jgi:hypothetical protein
MAQFLGHEWTELDTPFAQRLMADHNAALVEQFLNISVTEGKPVVQPDGMLDDRHGKTVAVRLIGTPLTFEKNALVDGIHVT